MTSALQLIKPQLPNRGRPTKFTPERIQQICNLVERGVSRDEIAGIIGVTTGTLQVTCSKLGISLRRPTCYQKNGSPNQSGSRRESPEKECAEGSHAVPEATTTEEARAGAPSAIGLYRKMNDGIPARFAIRMQYKGQERSTGVPLDEEMIGQLAIEAEIRSMRIGELVTALIRAIVKKDLFHLIGDKAHAHMHGSSGPLAGRASNTPSDLSTKIFETSSSAS
jgi:hypothetical protein